MKIFYSSSEKIYRLQEDQWAFILDCIEDLVNAEENCNGFIFDQIKNKILEKTEIY